MQSPNEELVSGEKMSLKQRSLRIQLVNLGARLVRRWDGADWRTSKNYIALETFALGGLCLHLLVPHFLSDGSDKKLTTQNELPSRPRRDTISLVTLGAV